MKIDGLDCVLILFNYLMSNEMELWNYGHIECCLVLLVLASGILLLTAKCTLLSCGDLASLHLLATVWGLDALSTAK